MLLSLFVLEVNMYSCVVCSAEVNDKRVKLGYDTCMICGDKQAQKVVHTVLPLHKSNYMLVTNREELIGFNTKGGIVK